MLVTQIYSSTKIMQKFNKNSWSFEYGQWTRINANEIVQSISQSQAEQLKLNSNRKESIIKEIMIVKFPNIKCLQLAHNNISSIEALVFVSLQPLQTLHLRDNNIFSIKILRKLKLKSLKWLSLNGNKISDYQHCFEANLPNLETLWLENKQTCQETALNLDWLFKSSFSTIKYIKLSSQRKNRSQKLLCQLNQKKYQNLNA